MSVFTYAILTVSDKGSQGIREDRSAPALAQVLEGIGGREVAYRIVPDDMGEIQQALIEWCDDLNVQLILTTGGTGLHPRDVTPDATEPLLEKRVPGMAEVMRSAGLKKTPHAMLSRGLVGIRGQSLIVNLPGSPKGAVESLEAIVPALPHALEKLSGDQTECAPYGDLPQEGRL